MVSKRQSENNERKALTKLNLQRQSLAATLMGSGYKHRLDVDDLARQAISEADAIIRASIEQPFRPAN